VSWSLAPPTWKRTLDVERQGGLLLPRNTTGAKRPPLPIVAEAGTKEKREEVLVQGVQNELVKRKVVSSADISDPRQNN
jgi:hypothetical protein